MSLSLSHWYPGSGVVLDCIDLHTYLLWPEALIYPPPGGFVCCPFSGSGSVVVDSLFTLPIVCVWLLFCDAALSVFFRFTTISMKMRELDVVLCLCSCCHVTVCVLCLSLTVLLS